MGYVDLLIARRPILIEILKLSNTNGPEGINFVRPEDLITSYADLFQEWEAMNGIKTKVKY